MILTKDEISALEAAGWESQDDTGYNWIRDAQFAGGFHELKSETEVRAELVAIETSKRFYEWLRGEGRV